MNQRKSIKERQQKRLTAAPIIIRALYKNVTGNEASLEYIRRRKVEQDVSSADKSLTYGEIVPSSFLQILGYTAPSASPDNHLENKSRVFYDLGCGIGRAVICAALSPSPFTKVIGIELIPQLCESANEVKECLLHAVTDSHKFVSTMNRAANKTSAKKLVPQQSKAKSKITLSMLSESQLILKIKEIVSKRVNDDNTVCTQEFLCNELTKVLGHKVYKASVQPLGKFSKFMENKTDCFNISSDGSVALINAMMPDPEYISIDPEIACCIEDLNRVSMDADLYDLMGDRENDNSSSEKNVLDLCDDTLLHESSDCIDSLQDDQELKGMPSDSDRAKAKIDSVTALLTTPAGYLEAITPLPEIEFIEGDIFKHSWHEDADVVYAASLLFTDSMMHELTEQVLKMKPGSWMISLKPLKLTSSCTEKVILKEKSFHKMSWQMAEVYIYQIAK